MCEKEGSSALKGPSEFRSNGSWMDHGSNDLNFQVDRIARRVLRKSEGKTADRLYQEDPSREAGPS